MNDPTLVGPMMYDCRDVAKAEVRIILGNAKTLVKAWRSKRSEVSASRASLSFLTWTPTGENGSDM